MLLDKRSELADAVAIDGAAGASWVNVGSVYDLRNVAPHGVSGEGDNITIDLGPAEVFLVVAAPVDILSTVGAGTLTLRVVSDAVTTPDVSTASVHLTTKAFVTNTAAGTTGLPAGTVLLAIRLPTGVAYERYLGIQILRTTNAVATGAVLDAFVTTEARRWRAYADALNGPVD